MAAFNKFNQFVEFLAEAVFDFENDTLKIILTNTAPVATNQVAAELTEIAATGGYTAGGLAVTVASHGQTAGVYTLVLDDLAILATGESIGPFRYFVLVDDTPTTPADPLVGWWDFGSAITLNDGESLLQNFSDANGVLQIT
jgi:hypothetical protein